MAFYVVYIQEAHPSDAWQVAANMRENVVFASPRSQDERGEVAGLCVRKLGIKIPALVDRFDNATEAAYSAWPDRLYVIGRDGRIAFKSAAGPFGFQPEGVARTLQQLVPR